MAWSACNKMEKIWKTNLERDFKISIFRATIELVLLYGSETWTLSAKQQRRLDGCYTRLLRRRVQNLSWKNHPTLETIYGNLPRISSILMSSLRDIVPEPRMNLHHLSFSGGFHHHINGLGNSPFQIQFAGSPLLLKKIFLWLCLIERTGKV